jgi:hypothetical protein
LSALQEVFEFFCLSFRTSLHPVLFKAAEYFLEFFKLALNRSLVTEFFIDLMLQKCYLLQALFGAGGRVAQVMDHHVQKQLLR